jgi:MFS family permease
MGDPASQHRGGWVNVGIAALLMVATLPGRTIGLGLLTEPIVRHFSLTHVQFGQINLWASLLGAAFCLPCGWLIDRLGIRPVMAVTLLSLAAVVAGMMATESIWVLAALILLARGFGQSALSVVSLAVVGKTRLRNRGLAMGVYAVLTGIGFAAAVWGVSVLGDSHWDWRAIWALIGAVLAVTVLPLCLIFLTEPVADGVNSGETNDGPSANDFTLAEALRTPAFWAVSLTCSLFLLVSSGTSLFYEDILGRLGFDRGQFLTFVGISFLIGSVFNLVCGFLSRYSSLTRLLGAGSLALAASLVGLPYVRTMPQLYVYGFVGGFSAGAVTVVFFAIWRPLFGATHLGKIQAAAQMLTVLASAISQWLFPTAAEWSGSYGPLFYVLAGAAVVLGVWVWVVPPPRRNLALGS